MGWMVVRSVVSEEFNGVVAMRYSVPAARIEF